MRKNLLKLVKIIILILLCSNSYSSQVNSNIVPLTEVEQILNMNIPFSNIRRNIEINQNKPQQKEHIENFYHYVFGNNSYNLVIILSYGTPNILNNINGILNINAVKNYIQLGVVENKIISTINGIKNQFIETDIYGIFSNTPEDKNQFKNTYSYVFNKTFEPYFNEINNFNRAVIEFRHSNRNMYGNDNEARNIINILQNCFITRANFINNKQNSTVSSWEDIFNKALQYQSEQKNEETLIQS